MSYEFILILFVLLIAEPLFYMRKKLQLGAAITEVNVSTQERVLRLIGIFCIVYLFVFRDASQYRTVFANFSRMPGTVQFRFMTIGTFLLAALGLTAYASFKKPEIYELGFALPFKAVKWEKVESYRLRDCTLELKLKRLFTRDYKLVIPDDMRERVTAIIQEQLNGKERL